MKAAKWNVSVLGLVLVALALLGAPSVWAAGESYSNSNLPNLNQVKGCIIATYFEQCANYSIRWDLLCEGCDLDKCSWISTVVNNSTNTGTAAGSYSTGSIVDNMGFNHIHTAWDYQCKSETPGCSSCGAVDSGNNLPKFDLLRIHRFRDVAYPSNFGPGVYSNYDIKIFLYALQDGTTLIDLWDPNIMNLQRFVDGPYPTHPFNPNDPKDGTYVSFRTNSHASLQLLDANGVPATDQANAVQGVLKSWDGRKFTFQIVSIDGQRVGRITRGEDRNGYGISLGYKFNIGDDLGGSESKLWQINTVTDAYGLQAVFSYYAQTQGGRWSVQQIAMPNGTTVSYSYAADGYLSGVSYPDGTASTFTRTFDPASNCTIYGYFDSGADGVHRAKNSYLTTNFAYNVYMPDDIIPQSASLVRLITNGAGEISYWNLPLQADGAWLTWVFEGNGLAKKLNAGTETCYAKTWTLTRADGQSWSFNSMSATTEWPGETLFFSSWDQPWYKGEAYQSKNANGLTINYTFNSASKVISKTYADATTETFSRNEFQQVTQYKDRSNRVTQWTFDTRGNMLSKTAGLLWQNNSVVTTPETATWTWEYYPAGDPHQFLLKKSFDANGNFTLFAYDSSHRVYTITMPADVAGGEQGITTFSYDTAGRLSSTQDPVQRIVDIAYDQRCRPSVVTYHTYPAFSTEEFTYYTTENGGVNANLLKQKKDRNGVLASFEYDLAGRQTLERMGAGTPVEGIKTCAYVPGTTLRSECIDFGDKTTYGYNYRNQLVSTVVRPSATKTLTTSSSYTQNKLMTTTDAYARKTYFVYDVYVRVTRVIRELIPGGVPTGANLTTLARLTTNNPNYVIETMEYNAAGDVTARNDANNNRSTFLYDSQGRLIEENAAVGTTVTTKTQYQYDGQGNRTRIIHPRTFTEVPNVFYTDFTYTNRNLLKTRTEAATTAIAATESYTYYADGRIKDTTDARGYISTTKWRRCCPVQLGSADPSAKVDDTGVNKRGLTITGTDYGKFPTYSARIKDLPASPTADWWRNPTEADTLNEVTTHYDARNRVDARTVWLAPLTSAAGNSWLGVDGRGYKGGDANTPAQYLKTSWVYDDNLTDSVGLDATYATQLTALLGANYFGAGADGSAVEETNPNNEKTLTVLDGVGRVLVVIDGNGNGSKNTFDTMVSNLLETKATDPLGHVSKSRADGAGRVRQSEDALVKVTSYFFDSNGNLKKARDPNNVGFDATFDQLNRETQRVDTKTVDAGGNATGDRITYREFDTHSNVKKTKDTFNRETVMVYDARDRKTDSTDRLSGTTHYAFDGNNNLTSLTDAETRVTSYVLDPRNLVVAEIYPLGQFADADTNGDSYPDARTCTYLFDSARRLTTRLDQALATTTFSFDMANRLAGRGYPDALNDTFTYDPASRLATATSARYSNTVTRVYDLGGRMTSETLSIGGQNFPVQSGYDAANRRTSLTYPDTKVALQGFTDRNQLQSVSYNGAEVANMVYDNGMRQTTKNYGNGKVETRTYRTDNRVNTIAAPGVTGFSFTYDVNKNPLTKTSSVDTADSQTYTYDFEDRLATFQRQSGFTQGWTLSLVGDWQSFNNNGTPETRTHNNVHELTQINATPLAYDTKGNLVTNSNAQSYLWDHENLMKQATVGADTAVYSYDALRRRVKKTFQGASTVFVYDGWRCISEYENGALPAAPARDYVFGSYLDEVLAIVSDPAGAQVRRYVHTDHLYSVHALTDAAGTVVERYRYTAYGAVTVLTGAFAPKADPNYSEFGNPWTYTGQRLDKETGLNYYKNRQFSAGLGRFVGRDSWGYLGGMNTYEYVNSFPVKMADPHGLLSVSIVKGPLQLENKKVDYYVVFEISDLPYKTHIAQLNEVRESYILCDKTGDSREYAVIDYKHTGEKGQKYTDPISQRELDIGTIYDYQFANDTHLCYCYYVKNVTATIYSLTSVKGDPTSNLEYLVIDPGTPDEVTHHGQPAAPGHTPAGTGTTTSANRLGGFSYYYMYQNTTDECKACYEKSGAGQITETFVFNGKAFGDPIQSAAFSYQKPKKDEGAK